MSMKTRPPYIVGLGGSLRERSFSRAATREALRIAEAKSVSTELLDLRELNLPMFTPKWKAEDYPAVHHAGIVQLLTACRRADALLWVSPTYHGTVSGLFKNALDFMELLADDDPPYLQGKVVGLIAVSDPLTFGAMKNSAHELRAWLAPTHITLDQREDFNEDLTLKEGRAQRRVARLLDELIEFASHRAAKRP
jgi:FMN reductase